MDLISCPIQGLQVIGSGNSQILWQLSGGGGGGVKMAGVGRFSSPCGSLAAFCALRVAAVLATDQ